MFECGWSVTPRIVLTVAVSVSRLLRLLGDLQGDTPFLLISEVTDGDFLVFLCEFRATAFGVLGEVGKSLFSRSDSGSSIDGNTEV